MLITINRRGYKIYHASLFAAAVQGEGCGFLFKKSNAFFIMKTTLKIPNTQRVTILASVKKKLAIYVINCIWMPSVAHTNQFK